jgi:DNA-binding PadR family transcriptional regulator
MSKRVLCSPRVPRLRRLGKQALLTGEWGPSENNRRARYYTITRSGKARLAEESATGIALFPR